MQVSTNILIAAPKERVWQAITDIDNSTNMLFAIISVKVLERPEQGLIGLKWRETRMMFGKEASETMWITHAEENKLYKTRAESHGSIYMSELSVAEEGDGTRLMMSFDGQPQTFTAKLMLGLLSFFVSKSMQKAIDQDMADIKAFVEGESN